MPQETTLEERNEMLNKLKQDSKFQEHLKHVRDVECFSYEELAAACFGALQLEQILTERNTLLQMRVSLLEKKIKLLEMQRDELQKLANIQQTTSAKPKIH